MTKKKKEIHKHLNGMHEHLVALEKEIYLGNGIKRQEAKKLYKDLLRLLEALDETLDPRSGK